MLQSYGLLSWVVAFGLAVTLSCCGSTTSQEKRNPTITKDSKAQEKPAGQGEQTEQGDHADHNAHADASPKDTLKGLAELSADDRAAAEKQRVCPVSGDALGSNGKPVKVTVKGKTVFLCCSDCEKAIMKDPDKYLAKLKDAQSQ